MKINQDKQEKVKMNMDQLLQKESMKNYLKMDILLMQQMLNDSQSGSTGTPIRLDPISIEQQEKIKLEILASLPKNNELEEFFLSQVIGDEARQLNMNSRDFSGSVQMLTPEEKIQLLIKFIEDDMELTQYQKELKKMREIENNFSDEAQKIEYQKKVNALETEIREFGANWSKKERLRAKNAKREEFITSAREDTITSTGSSMSTNSGGLENPSTGSGFRVPNNRPSIQSGVLDLVAPKNTNSGTEKMTSTGSITPKNAPIVSGIARPKVGTTKPTVPAKPTEPKKPIVSGTATPLR